MATLSGVENFGRQTVRIRQKVARVLQTTMEDLGKLAVKDLRVRASLPYRTYTTYVRDKPKIYPPGTIGVYSVKSSAVAHSRAGRMVALYPTGTHRLRDELTYSVKTDPQGRSVSVDVGYPAASTAGRDKQAYIRHVLMGTSKMQGRNFILEFFRTSRRAVFLKMRQAGFIIVKKGA